MNTRRLILLAMFSVDVFNAHAASETSVRFELKEHLIVVRADVGELRDIRLAIDTGTSTTIISPKLAGQLDVSRGRMREVLVLGERRQVREVELPRLCLGEICYEQTRARVSPLHAVPVDGLLGLDVLKRQSFTIDFESMHIRFGPVSLRGSSQRFVPQLPFIVTRLTVGEKILCLLLDSGGGDLILFRRRVKDSLQMEHSRQKIGLEASGVVARAEVVYLREISLGTCRWRTLRGFLLPGRQTDSYGTLDGILGLGSLGLRRIAFDFEHSRVIFQHETDETGDTHAIRL